MESELEREVSENKNDWPDDIFFVIGNTLLMGAACTK